MKKDRYFVLACQHKAHYRRAWVISAFSITQEGPDDWKKDPYPCRIVRTPTGSFFVNPQNTTELLELEGANPTEPLFKAKAPFKLLPGDIPNYRGSEPIITSYGNYLFNWTVLVFAFGVKMGYINPTKPISIPDIESELVKISADDPKEGEPDSADKIHMKEYRQFVKAVYHWKGFSWLFVVGATKKILLPPPGVKEFRDSLLEKYKDSLGDTATLAKIDDAMLEFDAQYLKGDPGNNFLIDKKTRVTSRKKLFLIHGAEVSLSANTTKAKVIVPSLSEGVDIKMFPEMMDGVRAGSFFRGAETMLGGVSAKELLRASANINILPGDCQSTIGLGTLVTPDYAKGLFNFSIVEDGKTIKIQNSEQAGSYLGKYVQVRSTAYCHYERTDYCSVCAGDRLALNSDGASIEIMGYGSAFLRMSLKKMHSNVLSLATMNYKQSFT